MAARGRKQKAYLERCWRHTLQAKPLRRGKTLTPPHLQPVQSLQATSSLHTDNLGRRGQGELSGTAVLLQTPWARAGQPPGQTNLHLGKRN
jgi:hypothetical protein